MGVDQLLKKNFWIVILPMIGLAALLDARAVTELIGVGLLPEDKQLAVAPAMAKVAPSSDDADKRASADPILERNPFDHVTGSLMPAPGTEDDGSGVASSSTVDTSDPFNAPECSDVKVLVIAASGDPEWSFAALSSGSDKEASVLRRRGGEVNGKKVHYVGWDRVWFDDNGGLCQAKLFAPEEAKPKAKPAKTATTKPKRRSRRRGAKPLDPSIAKGIQKVSPTEFNIDRGVVDKILENQADLMRQARIVPEQENGKVVGIRMFGVRSDTLLGHLGMQNGDRLQTVNGFDMSSPEKALEAYARLRTADKLTVQINRRGKNINLDYNIK